MPELDPKSQKRLVEMLAKSAKASGRFAKPASIADFHSKLRANLAQARARKPWAMQLSMCINQIRLRRQERRLNLMAANASHARMSELVERVESLRFGAHYGTCANAQQRTNCLRQIAHYHFAPVDAQFLVWAKVINFRKETINYGHWDWICGVFWTPSVLNLFVCALLVALSARLSPETKAIFTTGYLVIGCYAYSYIKAVTFDAFWIGSRYFKPNGWRYTPLPR